MISIALSIVAYPSLLLCAHKFLLSLFELCLNKKYGSDVRLFANNLTKFLRSCHFSFMAAFLFQSKALALSRSVSHLRRVVSPVLNAFDAVLKNTTEKRQ